MFFISICLVLFSSFLILSALIKDKKETSGFLYLLLIAFSQIVLSFEILSLFKLISKNGFLVCNIICFIVSIILFIKSGNKIYTNNFKTESKKILYVLKKDKSLSFLSVCFCIFLISQLIRALFFPVTFGDALTYYLPRCTAWIQNGCINHYITPDSRELIMPVNMEFLYTWLLLFKRSEIGSAIFSYISFLGAIYVIYNFLKDLGFTIRRSLWSIFVFSSFALVAVEMYTPSADLFIGSLILSCIYLFLKATKYNDTKALYFSSLSYALAVGTKTTSIIAIPSVFVVLLIILYLYKKEHYIKNILVFGFLFIINFLIFSSYNYILNLIQFSNPVSCNEQLLLNQFRGGFKGWLCNLIKYIFAIFDISGIKDYIGYNGFISYMQSLVLSIIGATDKSFTSGYFNRYFYFDSTMSLMHSALGIMGLFAFLPSLLKSIKKYLKNNKNKRNIIMASLTLSLILNLIIFARTMVFTQFNMRYLLTFIVIASPIVAYSYIKSNKNLFKILLCWFMFVYFVVIAHRMPLSYIFSYTKYKTNNQVKNTSFLLAKSDEIDIYNYLLNKDKKNIGLIISQVSTPNYYIEKLRLSNYIIEKILPENIEEYDLSKFDYIITNKLKSSSTNILNFKQRMLYPNFYVSKCIYNDYKQSTIYDFNTNPAMIECEIPLDYIKGKGFTNVTDIQLEQYIILENLIH